MSGVTYEVELVIGLRPSDRRGVVLLASVGDPDVDAAAVFADLDEDQQRTLRQRFDQWIENARHNNRWFHGFDSADCRDCFVFKWKHKNMGHRLYGFLWHPQPRRNGRFQLCVLTNHARKPAGQWETDPAELGTARRLRQSQPVQCAIWMRFPDDAVNTKPN